MPQFASLSSSDMTSPNTFLRYTLCAFVSVTLPHCASTRVYDMPKVQSNVGDSMLKTENTTQKALADYAEKKLLIDNLAKNATPNFRENEGELRGKLKRMDKSLKEIAEHKKRMIEAKGDIVALSYNREKVESSEKGYGLIEDAVKRFEAAVGAVNASVVDYSRESNSLADVIAQKRLYYNFDVAEFQRRLQKNIEASQDHQKKMEKELSRAENAILAWSRPDGRDVQEEIFSEMRDTAADYTSRAQRFAELSREIDNTTAGFAKVSTLDPHWQELQRLVSEFDRTSNELSQLQDKFQRKVETFRNPAKRVR